MRFFSKKSVAIVLVSAVVCGFANFGIVKAATSPASGTFGAYNNLTYLPCNPQDTSGSQSNSAACQYNTDLDQPYNTATAADLYTKTQTLYKQYTQLNDPGSAQKPGAANQILSNAWGGAKNVANIGAGLFTGPTFGIIMGVMGTIAGIVNVLLVVIAGIFDITLSSSVFQTAAYFNSNAVITGWQIFRDAMNMTFIFIILYIAISMILGTAGVKAKTTMTKVIVSAVFINFSMFLTKLLIDSSNIIATAFYNILVSTNPSIIGTQGVGSTMLSTMIMNTSVVKGIIIKSIGSISYTGQVNAMTITFLNIVLVCALIWFFIYATFMFAGRVCLFLFLTITSPVAFMGETLPWIKSEFSNKWWGAFIGQLVVAPIFFFLLYFIVTFVNSGILDAVIQGNNFFEKALQLISPDIAYGQIFSYTLVIVMLLYATKITKELGGAAAKVGTMALGGLGIAMVAPAAAAVVAGLAATAPEVAAGGAAAAAEGAAGEGATAAATRMGALKSFGSKFGRFYGSQAGKTIDMGKSVGNLAKLSINNPAQAGKQAFEGIAGGIKNATNLTGKFASNGFKDEEGVGARAAELTRGEAIKGISKLTGGVVNISAIEKALKKSGEENRTRTLKRVAAEAEAAGKAAEAGAPDEEARRTGIKAQAKTQAEAAPEGVDLKATEKENGENQKKYNEALKTLKDALAKNDTAGAASAKQFADSAKMVLDSSSEKLKKSQEAFQKKQKEMQAEIANKEYGTNWKADEAEAELNKSLEDLRKDLKSAGENAVRTRVAREVLNKSKMESIANWVRKGYAVTNKGQAETSKKILEGDKGGKKKATDLVKELLEATEEKKPDDKGSAPKPSSPPKT